MRLFIQHRKLLTNYYDETYNSFYTTSFSLIKNKSIDNYYKIFKKLDSNLNQYLPINDKYEINELHSDFELAIGSAAKKIYKNAMENKKIVFVKANYQIMRIYMQYSMVFVICFYVILEYVI